MQKVRLEKFLDFNPSESLAGLVQVKKIPLDALNTDLKTIDYYEWSKPVGGAKFRNGDTLVAKITPSLENGKTGKVTLLDDDEVGLGSTEFMVLRANQNSDSDFIYYFARSDMFRNKAISLMEGTSGRKRVNENALRTAEFYVPSLVTQKAIAGILSVLDDKIELNSKINSTLENLARMIYNYTFVQKANNRWETVNMVHSPVHRVIKSGLMDFDGEKIYYDTKRINENGISGRGDSVTNESRVSRANMQPVKCSIWFAKMKNTVKHVVLTNMDDEVLDGIFSTGMFGIEVDELAFEYVASFIKFSDFEKRKNDLAHGATQQAVNNQDIGQITFKLPDDQTLTKFHNQVAPIFKRIQINNQESAKLAKIRDFLLSQLMSGRAKVGE